MPLWPREMLPPNDCEFCAPVTAAQPGQLLCSPSVASTWLAFLWQCRAIGAVLSAPAEMYSGVDTNDRHIRHTGYGILSDTKQLWTIDEG